LALAAVLLLAGCASSGGHVSGRVGGPRLTDRSAVLVRVEGEGSADLRALVQQDVVRAINGRRLFGEVHTQTAAPAVVIVTITSVREVDRLTRLAFGASAGRASVNAHVELRQNGRTVGGFDADAHSSGGSIFAGGTDQAVEALADQVAAGLSRY
jgi:hypothetical protein